MRALSAVPRDCCAPAVQTRLVASPANGKDRGKDSDTDSYRHNQQSLAAFRRALLRWYDENRRDLPWRTTRDPYRIWLSEIMLQQTRVAAVLEHYRIFLERFPSIEALAAASEDAVLAAWSGLGYYQRARRLHQCAKEIVRKHDGRFPQRAVQLQILPGIGRYTAAAIASIAFGEPVAVVDGNVERVLRRLADSNTNGAGIKTTAINLTTAQIWNHAQTLLAGSKPGDFNQAMMELGATICLPREPSCEVCPVQKWCAAQQFSPFAGGAVTMERRAPPPGEKRISMSVRQVKKNVWCVLDQREGAVLLVQRPKKSPLMPGMWELPLSTQEPHPSPHSAHWRTFRHSITITDYTVHVLWNMRPGDAPLRPAYFAGKGKWIAIDRIPQTPITGLTRKILKAAGII